MRGCELPWIALLGFSLAACSGPRAIPDWAMHRAPGSGLQTRFAEQTPLTKRKPRLAQRPFGSDWINSRPTSMAERASPVEPFHAGIHRSDDPALFTTEWYAREESIDARLRRTMRICVNC